MIALAYLLCVAGSLAALALITRPRPVPTTPAPRVPAPRAADDELRLLAVTLARLADRLTA